MSNARAALVVLAFSLAFPCGAQAGTAPVVVTSGGDERIARVQTLFYIAAAGEVNRVTVSGPRSALVLRDTAGIQPGRGCRRVGEDRTRVRCVATDSDVVNRDVTLSDGNDAVEVTQGFAVVRGGSGDDVLRARGRLRGEDGNDELTGRGTFAGGPGNDVMTGSVAKRGTADSFLEGDPGNGSDTIDGRGGQDDLVSYGGRAAPVRVDLEGDRDDGQAGENDRVAGVEDIFGGEGGDVLTGDSADNYIFGDGGDDTVAGGRGDDVLSTESLSNVTTSADRLAGGPGNDKLMGTGGPNVIFAGGGSDVVLAGDGADRVIARDHSVDQVACEAGAGDSVSADRRDLAQPGCEAIDRDGLAAAVPLDAAVFGPPDALLVQAGCPVDWPRRCVGTLAVVRRGRVVARRCFVIPRGRIRMVSFPRRRRLTRLQGRSVRLVARSRDRGGRRVSVGRNVTTGVDRAIYPSDTLAGRCG